MPLREADRRGRAVRGGKGLLERDQALSAIDDVLEAANAGTGRALLISGHPGMGKTRLHEATLDEARRADMHVLRASGSELEHNLAFDMSEWCRMKTVDYILRRSEDCHGRHTGHFAKEACSGETRTPT